MTDLLAAAELLTNDRRNRCQVGHPTHDTIEVGSWFGNWRLFDWEKYENTHGYCPANDEVSKSISVNGHWERFGTHLMLQILDGTPGLVIDVGAHIGWYAAIAGRQDYPVLAIEPDEENLRLLRHNCDRLPVVPALGWVGVNTPQVTDLDVRLLKVDIEGLEDEAVRVFAPLFEERRIDYALLEISPILADHYRETVQRIRDYGYIPYLVPDQDAQWVKFSEDPLGFTTGQVRLRVREVESLRQRDVLFVREGM